MRMVRRERYLAFNLYAPRLLDPPRKPPAYVIEAEDDLLVSFELAAQGYSKQPVQMRIDRHDPRVDRRRGNAC
jgi:hypothetical protein